jgi:hypothetical protein
MPSSYGLLMMRYDQLQTKLDSFVQEEFEEDDEKDEVDMAFALLKNRFKEADTNSDEMITKMEFKTLLEKITPSKKVSVETVNKVLAGIEDLKDKNITFKQYLYGMYLFATQS